MPEGVTLDQLRDLTPLPSDDLVATYAQKHGIPVDMARAQVSAESGGNPRAKSGAGAMGLLQLMPGTAKELGVSDPYDPHQNLDGGFAYLARLKKQFGDWDTALAAYNWGPGNVQGWIARGRDPSALPGETRAYVKRILGTPLQTRVSRRQEAIERRHKGSGIQLASDRTQGLTLQDLQRMQQPGAAPPPTGASSPSAAPAQGGQTLEGRIAGTWKALTDGGHSFWGWVNDPNSDVIGGILGAPQRGVGAIAYALEHSENFAQGLHEVLDDALHADTMHAARTTESIRALLHAPTDEETLRWVRSLGVPEQYVQTVAGADEAFRDFTMQTLSDPLTLAGGVGAWEKALKYLPVMLRGVKNSRAIAALLQSRGLSRLAPAFSHLGAVYQKTGGELAKTLTNLFAQRPDIDEWALPELKQARMQIEQIVRQKMGSVTSPAARKEVSRLTQGFISSYGGLRPGVQVQKWDKLPTQGWAHAMVTDLPRRYPQIKGVLNLVGGIRGLITARVFGNMLPHAFGNVGELAFLARAGGPKALLHIVPDSLRFMASAANKLPGGAAAHAAEYGKDIRRLEHGGASPEYVSGITHTLWDHVPVISQYLHVVQRALYHAEVGWRVGVLRAYDRQLGKSKNAREELLKMYGVVKHVGDYQNQAAFTQLFKLFGGAFATFHYGVIPRAILDAIAAHPERILALARAQDDLQAHRSAQGQADNILNLPGSPERFIHHPLQYLTNPMPGLPAELTNLQRDLQYRGLGRTMADEVARASPVGDVASIGIHALFGTAKPAPNGKYGAPRFQPDPTFGGRLLNAVLEGFGGYYSRQKSEAYKKQIKREEKIQRKRAHVQASTPFYEDF